MPETAAVELLAIALLKHLVSVFAVLSGQHDCVCSGLLAKNCFTISSFIFCKVMVWNRVNNR